jgi:invasion protein IalB
MTRLSTFLPLCIVAVVSMGLHGAMAQTTATPDPAPATEAPKIEDQLSLGTDANADPEIGQPYTKEVIGAWQMRCIKTETDEDPCQMYQLMGNEEGTPVAEISLFRLSGEGQAKAGATVVVPLETALPSQLLVQVDNNEPRRYPYAFCNPVGCYARIGLTEADVEAYKRGKVAKLTIVPALALDQKVELNVSLDGFTASYEKSTIMSQ